MTIKFTFKGLSQDQMAWAVVADSGVVLKESVSHVSSADEIIALQQTYQYVSLVLECVNTTEACRGNALIEANSDETPQNSNKPEFYQYQDHNCAHVADNVSIPVRGSFVVSCANADPGRLVTVDYAVSSPSQGGGRVTYSIRVYDDKNFDAWKNGGSAVCINQDCDRIYSVFDYGNPYSQIFYSNLQTKSFYFVVQDRRQKPEGPIPFAYRFSVSSSADIPNLTNGYLWNKASEYPLGCSTKAWPSSFKMFAQLGTFFIADPYPSNNLLRLDMNPPLWVVFDNYSLSNITRTWSAAVLAPSGFRNLTFAHHDPTGFPCSVTFVSSM